MFTDEDRLAMIKSLGGVLVHVRDGDFWATFDNELVDMAGGPGVEVMQPVLPDCRTSDILRLQINKDDSIEVAGESYRLKRHEPQTDGWSRMLLKR